MTYRGYQNRCQQAFTSILSRPVLQRQIASLSYSYSYSLSLSSPILLSPLLIYIYIVQLRMGCIPDSPKHKQQAKLTFNPIQTIIATNSIETLKEEWKPLEFKTMQQKMLNLPNSTVSFQQFSLLFPKIQEFSSSTQASIYKLFAYEGNRQLTKQEIVSSLTLILKVPHNSDFAPFLFYVYTSHPKHEIMTEPEFTRFKQENDKFLGSMPLNFTYEINSNDEEEQGEGEPSKKREEKEKIREGREKSQGKQGQQVRQGRDGSLEKTNSFNNKSDSLMTLTKTGGPESRMIGLNEFRQQFQKYNLVAYQVLFSWDPKQEEKELVEQMQREGFGCQKGESVYVMDYKWWLQWTIYVDQYYNQRIDFQPTTQNYQSARLGKRESGLKSVENSKVDRTTLIPPGEIKNGFLLKGKNSSQLMPNLVELDNYICLPERFWNKLVAIYHGGPPIQRTYPRIYHNLIIKTTLNSEGQFLRRIIKHSKPEKIDLLELAMGYETKWQGYYKYPGRSNWEKLPHNSRAQNEVFNSIKTFVVFVPPDLEDQFVANYNIHSTKHGRILKRRFKNYGAEINISVSGMLTKAQVTDILKEKTIRVSYLDQHGNAISLTVVIDPKLIAMNPDHLDLEEKLNELPGLDNLGNTCYMNGVLQCLIRTPYFGSYLKKEDFRGQRKEQGEELLLEELAQLEEDSRNSQALDIISTKNFKRVMDLHCPFFEGNLQHDAQEFLICLLVRLSEEIKSKNEYGSVARGSTEDINKKIVKFFSGKTEATTECVRCGNKNTRVETFFTYSLSLPEMKESEYHYYFIGSAERSSSTVPVRFGITLDRKVNVEDFLGAVAKTQGKSLENIVLFTVFNNQFLNRLEPRSWQQEIAHHLNFSVKLVCYEVHHMDEPTYHNYQKRDLAQRSVKLELRQRIYSPKTSDYRITYMPFLLEVSHTMHWHHLLTQIELILAKILPEAKAPSNGNPSRKSLQVSNNKLSTSGIRVSVDSELKNGSLLARSGRPGYKVRVIRSDHNYQNYCFFCKNEFVACRRSKSLKCRGSCGFEEGQALFDNPEFRNFNDNIMVTVDWEESMPDLPQQINHPSYDEAIARTEGRKDILEDILVDSSKTKETLDLRCEKKDCEYNWATRIESIAVPPNILLLHIKRFRYEDNRLVKLTNRVVYPQQLALPGTREVYELYGVVVHFGSGVGGHYISYVRVGGKWYCCDDSKVTLSSPGAEIDTNAYLLFYSKKDFSPSLMCLNF